MDGIDSGLYGDAEAAPSRAPAGSVDDQEQDAPTHLMDKSAFPGGCKVGDRYEIELVADHGEEFEVKILPEKGGETETEPSANEELDSMAEKY